MKKQLLLLVMMLLPMVAMADAVEIDGIYYNLFPEENKAQVTYLHFNSSSNRSAYTGEVLIPSEVTYQGKTYSVFSIGYGAFEYCENLTSITIPNSVVFIGINAFRNCSSLTSIAIPNSVTSIGSSAFENCTRLSSIAIPNSVTSIGSSAFENCTRLSSIVIPNSVTSIGSSAFKNCMDLSSITIPNSVTSLEVGIFEGCSGLSSVVIPNSVITIGNSAFYKCSNLTSIDIPNSVTSIEKWAFEDCTGLAAVTLPSSVISLGDWAFKSCSNLSSVFIPNNVKNIGGNPFTFCSSLTSVIVETGNANYDSRNNCNAIIEKSTNTLVSGCENTIIPNNVISIGVEAFGGCSGLTTIAIPEGVTSIDEGAFEGCGDITSIAIPNSLISIGRRAFYDCSNLTSITIPQKVTSIGDGAFNAFRGSSLTSVTVENPIPVAISENTFYSRKYAILYVPKGSKAAYEAADYWKEFKEIIEYANTGDPTANTLSLSAIEGNRGKQVVLPVALNNQHQITGLQMDLYLPAGVTIAKKANGKMMISTTDRMDGNYTLTGEAMDGFVRILGYSGDSDAFTGTSGDILNITLDLNSEMNAGDYTIQLKDIVLSDVNNTEYHPANVEAKLTVKSYTLGDVDDSGAININDVVCIINHILNRSNGTFISEAADVDENGTININDVVTLINRYILMRDNAPAYNNGSSRASMAESNYLHLDNIAIKPGETKEITMLLSNSNEVRGIQGNIKLPAGLSFVNKSNGRPDVKNIDARSEDFTLSCAVQDDGSMTFAQYSADGFSYTGSEGGIFTFKIKAADSATAGSYAVDLKGVVLSIDGVGYDIPDRSSSVVVTGTDGISEIKTTEPVDVYTLDGRKIRSKASDMSELPNGVYIVNGKKIVVK